MPPPPPPGLSELTVTCRQCGAADMLRLDRKEYKCRHCGAITVISEGDAGRIEQILKQFVANQQSARYPAHYPRRRPAVVFAGAAVVLVALVVAAALSSRFSHAPAGTTTAESYFAQQSVPDDQVVASSLHWQPGASGGGAYTGLLYNHSGYAISPPSYTLDLYKNGLKGDSASSLSLISTLEPGEYEPLEFNNIGPHQPDRYEIEQPTHIMHSTMEIATVPLADPTFIHVQNAQNYALIGIVRNTLKRPIQGTGQLLLYGPDGQIVGSGIGSLAKLTPGEQAILNMNAYLYSRDAPVTAYEYLLDTFYENQAQSVTLEQWQQQGKRTVPSRIIRNNHPQLRLVPAGTEWKPEDFLSQR